MSESQWWLYDLVVVSISVLCIWNGSKSGSLKSISSLLIGIVSFIAGAFLSEPISEMAYDTFFKDNLQDTITEELSNTDITGNIRSELENSGIYLPYDDNQIADMIEDLSNSDESVQQVAAVIGIDTDELEEKIEESLGYVIKTNDKILPSWVSGAITDDFGKVKFDSAADTAVAILRDDYSGASSKIENSYIKPVITGALKALVFILITSLFSSLLRMVLLVIPNKNESAIGKFMGAAFGAAKAAIYLYLIVLLVSSISSMQNGEYPFYNRETINQTYLFRIFYDMWQ